MSGGEPLWRRVAGLYLSGVPSDAGETVSRPASAAAPAADNDDDPQHIIFTLGEALDLVTLAQGYRSPAVPILLRALIRAIRQVSEERARDAETDGKPAHADTDVAADAPFGRSEEGGDEAPAAAPDRETPEPPVERAAEDGDADHGDGGIAETEVDTGAGTDAETAGRTAGDAATDRDEGGAPEREEAAAPDTLETRISETDQKLATLTAAVGQLVEVLQRRARSGGGVDRRASPRIPGGNAKIFIHDHPYEVLNWSAGGFQIRISEADRFTRGRLDFYFVLDLPDETIEFQGRARPVRIERTALAAEFAGLDDATAAKIGEIAARLAGAGQPA